MKTQPVIFNFSFGQRVAGSLIDKFIVGLVFFCSSIFKPVSRQVSVVFTGDLNVERNRFAAVKEIVL